MATATLTGSPRKLTARHSAHKATRRQPRQLIRVTIPYGVDYGVFEQAPQHAVVSQVEDCPVNVIELADRADAKALAAEINRDSDLGFRGWACRIVGITIEAQPELAAEIQRLAAELTPAAVVEELSRRKPR